MPGPLFADLKGEIDRLETFLNSQDPKENGAGAISWRLIVLGRSHKALVAALKDPELQKVHAELASDCKGAAIHVSKTGETPPCRGVIEAIIKVSREALETSMEPSK